MRTEATTIGTEIGTANSLRPRGERLLFTLHAALAARLGGAPAAWADLAAGKAAYAQHDYTRAYQDLLPDAQAGNPEAEYMLGEMAANGQGAVRSYALAIDWYQLVASGGYQPAYLSLGLLYLHSGGTEDDATWVEPARLRAAAYLKIAADAGDKTGQYVLGPLYMTGNGVPKDSALARQYTLEAAKRGVAGAQYNAGLLTLQAAGIAPDRISAYKWFALAARAQYPGAEENRKLVMGETSPQERQQADALGAAFHTAP